MKVIGCDEGIELYPPYGPEPKQRTAKIRRFEEAREATRRVLLVSELAEMRREMMAQGFSRGESRELLTALIRIGTFNGN